MALAVARGRASRGSTTLLAALLVVALAVGALVTMKPMYALALVAVGVVALLIARDISTLPYLLVFTMFMESVSLGHGLGVGRVAGALAIVVVIVALLAQGRAGLRPSALLLVAGGYGFWIAASAEWAWSPSSVPGVAVSYLLSASYALTFAVLIRRRDQLFGVARVLAFGSTIFGLLAFAYYVQHAGSISADATSGRASGLAGDPNYFAIFQIVALPAALVLAASGRTKRRYLYYGVVGIIVISVFSSLSRTGLIALTVAVLLTLILPWRIFFSAASQKLTYLVAIVGSGAVAVALGSSALVARVQTILNPNAQGSYRGAGREDLWSAALTGWHRSNELIGMGAGNFKLYSLQLLQTTPGVDTTQNYAQNAREVHNAYLENLTDLGVVGAVLFVLVLALAARSLLVSFRRARAAGDLDLQRFSLAFLVSLVGYALSAIFLSNQLAKVVWILVGLALALDVITRALPQPVAAGAETYDDEVGRGDVDDLARRLERMRQSLVADQERLDRRRAALDERERELAARGGAQPAAGETAPLAQVRALERLLASRDKTIDELRAQLAEAPPPQTVPEPAPQLVQASEPELVQEPEPEVVPEPEPELVQEPEPEPELVQEPEPVQETVPPARDEAPPPAPAVLELQRGGRWDLHALEAAVSAHRSDSRAEEWDAYLLFLREHAAADGLLPVTFDALVDEVFGDLAARVRAGA